MSIAGTGGHAPQLTSSSRDHKGCFSPRLPFQRIAVLLKDAHGPDGDLDWVHVRGTSERETPRVSRQSDTGNRR